MRLFYIFLLIDIAICIMLPSIPYHIMNGAYYAETGKNLPYNMPLLKHGAIRSTPNNSIDINYLIDTARTLCGDLPKVYPADIQEH